MQNSEPVILQVKICKETYSWFFKKMSQWLAETHKKSFLFKKMDIFDIKESQNSMWTHGPRVKYICHKR